MRLHRLEGSEVVLSVLLLFGIGTIRVAGNVVVLRGGVGHGKHRVLVRTTVVVGVPAPVVVPALGD